MRAEMMADKSNDPLERIYEDIADHYKQSHFKDG